MLSCDYNGWNDAPEAEREWFDEHPEIWSSIPPDTRLRAGTGSRRSPQRPHQGGIAA